MDCFESLCVWEICENAAPVETITAIAQRRGPFCCQRDGAEADHSNEVMFGTVALMDKPAAGPPERRWGEGS